VISFPAYKALPQDSQIDLLLEFGVYLQLMRNTSHLSIELYALEDFYVEIYFDRKTEHPLFLRAFNCINELQPYFTFIEIDGIFETK
jgi:hypothetical protein